MAMEIAAQRPEIGDAGLLDLLDGELRCAACHPANG
jgi:hypothetical protein